MENIRVARSEQRDLLQDLRDMAEGIEVRNAVDLAKQAVEKKRAAKRYRRELKERRAKRATLPAPQAEEQFSIFGGDFE